MKFYTYIGMFCFLFLSACSLSNTKQNTKGTSESDVVALSNLETLGKVLYFDPRLSADGSLSCNSCHNVMNGGVDNRSLSAGINGKRGDRNSPTVFNAKFLSVQFWDGRANTLAEQAKGPLTNPVEMGNQTEEAVVERIKQIPGYKPYFDKAFPNDENPITIDRLAVAIAAYEETLTTLNSPYDKFMQGDESAMNDAQKKGLAKFQELGCTACHSGDHFAGPALPIGTGFYQRFPTFTDNPYVKKYNLDKDLGRYQETKAEEDKHMFRVPTLRNIALTAPYFHNGQVETLDEALRVMAKLQLNKDLSDEDVNDLVAFLEALTGTVSPQVMPTLPPTSGFTVGKID